MFARSYKATGYRPRRLNFLTYSRLLVARNCSPSVNSLMGLSTRRKAPHRASSAPKALMKMTNCFHSGEKKKNTSHAKTPRAKLALNHIDTKLVWVIGISDDK